MPKLIRLSMNEIDALLTAAGASSGQFGAGA